MKNIFRIILLGLVILFASCKGTTDSGSTGNDSTNNENSSGDVTLPTVATPIFSRESGEVHIEKTTLTVQVDTIDAKIKYAFGTDDPINGTEYKTETGIELDFTTHNEVMTVRAIAVKDGFENSLIEEITLTAKKMPMHPIASGTFTMGNPDEATADKSPGHNEYPSREIELSSFFIGTHEVTQGQWKSVMGTWPNTDPATTEYGSSDNHPAYNISWYNAIEFCNKLSSQEGLKPYYSITKSDVDGVQNWKVELNAEADVNAYRLPTEAEWEFAAGGGIDNRTKYAGTGNGEPTGDNALTNYAWYSENAKEVTHEVGTRQANSLGLYDMNGNVWEWCWDRIGNYSKDPNNNPIENPTGPTSGSTRVARGGAWDSDAERLRVVERGIVAPHKAFATIGFRVARNVN